MELSAERSLSAAEYDSVSDVCLALVPVMRSTGDHEMRGLASVDEDALWVYVHSVGPGLFTPQHEAAARELLGQLWRDVHAGSGAR